MKPREYCLDKILTYLAENFNKPDKDRINLNAKELLEDFGLLQENESVFCEFVSQLFYANHCDMIRHEYFNNIFSADISVQTSFYQTHLRITDAGNSFIKNGGYTNQKQIALAKEIEEKAKETLAQELTKSVLAANNSSIQTNVFLRFSNGILIFITGVSAFVAYLQYQQNKDNSFIINDLKEQQKQINKLEKDIQKANSIFLELPKKSTNDSIIKALPSKP